MLMTILNVLHFPDPRLRHPAQAVDVIDDAIRMLVRDMFETMYDAPGIGLAATQVDVQKSVIVMDVSETKTAPRVFINPRLVKTEGQSLLEEGCLSVPGIYEPVERFANITVQALDEHGQVFELMADDLLSVCIQHEMDHLEGKLFVDYLSTMKRERIKKKMQKLRRKTL